MRQSVVILGYGKTGQSIERFLAKQDAYHIVIMDDNVEPDHQNNIHHCDSQLIHEADLVITSPGISPQHPMIVAAMRQQIPIKTDLDFWMEDLPQDRLIFLVTGSNGKSTVSSMLGHLLTEQGIPNKVIGNIGVPVLDSLDDKAKVQAYVIELSSYQLHHTQALRSHAAIILNLSPDHLDWHGSMTAYQHSKEKIFHNTKRPIVYDHSQLDLPNLLRFGYGTHADYQVIPGEHQYDVSINQKVYPLQANNGIDALNQCACLALTSDLDLDIDKSIASLSTFKHLPHRRERIPSNDGICWINDAKSTNVASLKACLESFDISKSWIIMGGQTKHGDDWSALSPILSKAKGCLCYGQDANRILDALDSIKDQIIQADCLKDAVKKAKKLASPHDFVICSPGCASFDAFKHFEHRGECFTQWVLE